MNDAPFVDVIIIWMLAVKLGGGGCKRDQPAPHHSALHGAANPVTCNDAAATCPKQPRAPHDVMLSHDNLSMSSNVGERRVERRTATQRCVSVWHF